MILDLYDTAPDPEEESGRPRLRLVPRGLNVAFSLPRDPETPWPLRISSVTVAIVLTTIGVTSILLTAAAMKHFYDKVDAQDAARAKARAVKAAEAAPRPDGAILLKLPEDTAKGN